MTPDPWLDDGDVTLYHGDALTTLATLPAGSVQTCVTSPPYWGLRDYGADGQIGLEATPDRYVQQLVTIFSEVRRVLRDDGTVWLNLGDSYAAAGGHTGQGESSQRAGRANIGQQNRGTTRIPEGFKPKDLVGIPWRVAFALQADGWYLRSDIVWSKSNPMPESVTDRPTKAHEYVFLLSKQPRYYWDADAIREPHAEVRDWPTWEQRKADGAAMRRGDPGVTGDRCHWAGVGGNPAGRNVRSVWEIATQPTPDAHFATFPEELVRRCILAGTSERGECGECGAPWRRVLSLGPSSVAERRAAGHKGGHSGSVKLQRLNEGATNDFDNRAGGFGNPATRETTGWEASCTCAAPSRPQTVLDPFIGSGTTALVARKHGRRAIGIDLNEAYLHIAAKRTNQQSLFA